MSVSGYKARNRPSIADYSAFSLVALLVQLGGAVLVAGTRVTDENAADKLNRGKNTVLIGLGVQLACFGFFAVVATRFYFISGRFSESFNRSVGISSSERHYIVDNKTRKYDKNWPMLLLMINISCTLILVRIPIVLRVRGSTHPFLRSDRFIVWSNFPKASKDM